MIITWGSVRPGNLIARKDAQPAPAAGDRPGCGLGVRLGRVDRRREVRVPQEHISILESAISDVGHWTWWTQHFPESFQMEFGGVLLWNPPTAEGKPPSEHRQFGF